jgi:adenylate cyclase class IV
VACIKYNDSCLRISHHNGFKPKKLKYFGPEISQNKKFNYYLQTFLHKISFLRQTQRHVLSMLANQHLAGM